MFKKIANFFKSIFCWKKKTPAKAVYQEITDIKWTTCPAGPSSWNQHAGLEPQQVIIGREKAIRLNLLKSDENPDGWQTAAIKTVEAFPDGKFECYARFKSGKGTWPAIWMSHPGGAADNYKAYYEIDLSEYYENRDNTETTFHFPASMRKEAKFINKKTKINPEEWTKFVCTWDEKSICVYINDSLVFEVVNNGNSDYFPVNAEDRTFQIILSMQAGSHWLQPVDLSQLPLYMDIKKLKIYKKL